MKDRIELTASVKYVKPEIVDLGAAALIQGGSDCNNDGSAAGGAVCISNGSLANMCSFVGSSEGHAT